MLPADPVLPAQLVVQLVWLKHLGIISQLPLRHGRLDSQEARLLLWRLQQLCHINSQGPVSVFELCTQQSEPGSCLKGKAAPKGQQPDARAPAWLQPLQCVELAGGRLSIGCAMPELSTAQMLHMRMYGWHKYVEHCDKEDIALLKQMRSSQAVTSPVGAHVLVCHLCHSAPTPEHDQCCHYICDNKLCLNPRHMCWGNVKDNAYHREWHKEYGKLKNLWTGKQRWPDPHAPPAFKKSRSR